MPAGLPPVVKHGDHVDVPRVHWDAITELRYGWAGYPGLVLAMVDDLNGLWGEAVLMRSRAEAARMAARNITRAGIAPWKAYLGAILGLVGGGLVGFAVGAIVVAVGS